MSISDAKFEETMQYFEGLGKVGFAENLRARDTAKREALAQLEGDLRNLASKYDVLSGAYATQREALARVEEERNGLRVAVQHESAVRRHTSSTLSIVLAELQSSQAQLVDAVGLLKRLYSGHAGYSELEAFLARHAQAEQQEVCWQCGGTGEADTGGVMSWGAPALDVCPCQQEAQGAQAVDERAAFESSLDPSLSRETFVDEEGDTVYRYPWVQGAWIGWSRRAALATQPAVIKLPERRAYNGFGAISENLASVAWNQCLDAVENLNAVRGAEHE